MENVNFMQISNLNLKLGKRKAILQVSVRKVHPRYAFMVYTEYD